MALTAGSRPQATAGDKIETVLPIVHTVSAILVAGTDAEVYVDATAGDVVLTLPDAAASPLAEFFIKRIDNSDNSVAIDTDGGDIDTASDFMLGLQNELIQVKSDATDWKVFNSKTNAISAISFDNVPVPDTGQTVTDTPAVITAFDTDVFGTPGRIIADSGNGQLDILHIANPIRDGYRVEFNMFFAFANNVDILFEVFVDGVATGKGGFETGRGASVIPMSFNVVVAVPTAASSTIEVRVSRITGSSTLTVYKSDLIAERIGG